jgi:glycine/D-amino acid oxidase-like deaminating enzyme
MSFSSVIDRVGSTTIPGSAAHVVVGGGVYGLSVAPALARRLRADGSAARVVLVERGTLGSGASGIAGGIVRGYYRSPAITEIVRISVEQGSSRPPTSCPAASRGSSRSDWAASRLARSSQHRPVHTLGRSVSL